MRRDIAAAHGLPWPERATADMMGMSSNEWSAYMVDRVGVPLAAEEVNRAVVAGVIGGYRARLPLITGSRQAVGRLARRFPLGLASSSNREVIDAVLAAAGLREAFRVTVSSEEVGRGKPAPDVYLRAVELLGASPEATVAVEDSSNGIRSAHGAGLRVVCIPHAGFPPAPDALALADEVLPSAAWLWAGTVRGLVGV